MYSLYLSKLQCQVTKIDVETKIGSSLMSVEEKSVIGPKMLIYCENQNFHTKKFLCIFFSLVTAGHWAESNVDRHWRFNLLWRPRKHKTDAC